MQAPLLLMLLAACCAAPPAWAASRSRSMAGRLAWAGAAALLAALAFWAADPIGQALMRVDGRLAGATCGL